MESSAAEELVTAESGPVETAYPTLLESWGIVGWYLLTLVVVGVPLFLVCDKALSWPKPVTNVVMTVLCNLALLAFLRWKAGVRWQPLRAVGQEQLWLYAVLPILVLAQAVVLSVLSFLHLPNWMQPAVGKLAQTPFVAFLLLVIVAPLTEEVLSRGIILRGLLRQQRPWVAIGQSALLFGLVHFNPAQSINAFLLGIMLGWLYYRTQSLWLCMALHAAHNLLVFWFLISKQSASDKPNIHYSFRWICVYAGVLLLAIMVIAVILRRVRQTTTPVVAETEGVPPLPWASLVWTSHPSHWNNMP